VNINFLVITLLVGVVIIGSVIGAIFILAFSRKTTRRYRTYVSEMKKQNTYLDWTTRHRDLVFLEKIDTFLQGTFLLALILFVGSVKEYIEIPRTLLYVSGILVWMFWPYFYVSRLILSRRHKQILGKELS
jgi:hypothetical protein